MEILWWLAPPAGVTVVAMIWVSWLGRENRGEVDPEVANARLAAAMEKDLPARRQAPPPRRPDRSTGIAVRPSRRPGPDAAQMLDPAEARRPA